MSNMLSGLSANDIIKVVRGGHYLECICCKPVLAVNSRSLFLLLAYIYSSKQIAQ